MEIVLSLSQTELGLLKALAPRGAARQGDDYLERAAKSLLLDSMRREAKLRRITPDQISVTALVEAVKARKERIT